jgi:hypothetical protein
VVSPYRDVVVREFNGTKYRSTWTSRCRLWRPSGAWANNQGVAFLPRICRDNRQENLVVKVKELQVERKIRLVYPSRRALSHAARAFLDVVKAG